MSTRVSAITPTSFVNTASEIVDAPNVLAHVTGGSEPAKHVSHPLEELVRSVPGVVWEAYGSPAVDGQRTDYVSSYVETMLGYTVEEWLSTPNFWLKIVHPEDREQAAARASELFLSGRAGVNTFRWITKQGEAIWIEAHSTGILDEQGKPIGMRGVSMDISDRKRADDELLRVTEELRNKQSRLEASERQLRLVVNTVPALISYLDTDFVFRYNNSYKSRWRRDAEVLGKHVSEVLGEANFAHIQKYLERALKGETVHYESPLESTDGDPVYCEITYVPDRSVDGNVQGIITFVTDITDRVKAEEALRASEERFRSVANTAPVLLWLCDEAGRRYFFNNGWLEFTGTTLDANDGFGWRALIHPDDAARQFEAYKRALHEHIEYALELRLRHSSGEYKWILSRGIPRFNEASEFVGLVGSCIDISARKQAEDIILESREHFRVLAESMPQVVWTATSDGRRDYFNQYWYDYTGLSEVETMTTAGREKAYHPEDFGPMVDRWMACAATGTPYEMEFRLRRASDNTYRWHSTRAVPVRDAEGKILSWVGSLIDIHDQRQITEELRRAKEEADAANRAKDHFLATLSHELRTPLTPIMTTVEALETEDALPSDLRPYLSTIRRNIELEARLIDDLLDLTRITRGKLHLTRRTLEINGLVNNVLEICRKEISNKRLEVRLSMHAEHTHIDGDPARIQQILWNIVQNAVKFTPAEGTITIRTSNTESGKLRIEITDSGIGIEADHLPLIFQPFEQGDRTITRQFGGLGLGLAISHKLVEMHDGTLEAASEGRDTGSTFSLEFGTVSPLDTESPAAQPTRKKQRTATANKSVLLVDDHADTNASVKMLLERRGYQVATADSMTSALAIVAEGDFDIIVSDIGLPDGSGWELLSKVRETSQVKAIALSGYCTDEDKEHSRSVGFNAHLTKPFSFPDLQRTIEELLK